MKKIIVGLVFGITLCFWHTPESYGQSFLVYVSNPETGGGYFENFNDHFKRLMDLWQRSEESKKISKEHWTIALSADLLHYRDYLVIMVVVKNSKQNNIVFYPGEVFDSKNLAIMAFRDAIENFAEMSRQISRDNN